MPKAFVVTGHQKGVRLHQMAVFVLCGGKFSTGDFVNTWVWVLYNDQVALIVLEGCLSKKIMLKWRVRQGCPSAIMPAK